MERRDVVRLEQWLAGPARRPLVLRGARQVGKTWLVRELSTRSGRALVELNFERDAGLARHFAATDPRVVLGELSLALGREVLPERSILFLDEIQAAGHLLARLRWFAEELPELPVVAAGSLLEFTLADHSFSMPVGRVGFRHVEPMGFAEYLLAHQQGRLLSVLGAWRPGDTLSPAAHEKATAWFHRYSMVGGMPAVVGEDVARSDARRCRELQKDLVAGYRADFARYSGRMNRELLDTTLRAVARSVGQKFIYSHVGEGVKQHQAKHALELLAKARLCHLARHSHANGLPLGGEAKDTLRKAILLDVGLLHALLETPASSLHPSWASLAPQVRGQLADQLAGQQLRLLDDGVGDGPELYYWQREGGRPGEIDYLVQLEGRIVPIELKAGPAGSMKSLQHFMLDKQLDLAVRLDANPPAVLDVDHATTHGERVWYRLLTVPLYLAWALKELVPAALEKLRSRAGAARRRPRVR